MPDPSVVLMAVVLGVASKINLRLVWNGIHSWLLQNFIMGLKGTYVRRTLKLSRKKSIVWMAKEHPMQDLVRIKENEKWMITLEDQSGKEVKQNSLIILI